MWSKTLFLLLLSHYTYGQRAKKFFRYDYKYLEETDSFYKYHTIKKTWSDAKAICKLEGGFLFYPENQAELDAVTHDWNETQHFSVIYIGIASPIMKGVFETVDGNSMANVYNKWGRGEPNDINGKENCVVLRSDGTLNDVDCSYKYQFACKKSLASLEWNEKCDIPDKNYKFNEQSGRCYKVHYQPKTWAEAYAVCAIEQSYLGIIDSKVEADHFASLIQPKTIRGPFLAGVVHLGFHDKNDEGWQTLKGENLEDSGYAVWAEKQPSNGAEEKCGSMMYNGQLNDVNCSERCIFICERDVDSLATSLDNRNY